MKEIKKKFHPIQIVVLAFLMTFGLFAGNILPQLKNAKAAPCNLVIDVNACDGGDAVIDGGTVTISGSHTFNSLTIKNNGVLTHDAFTAGENPVASDKKVDLDVTGNIILETGGSINADGKGYPGGDSGQDGSGPNANNAGKGAAFSWNGSGNKKGAEGGGGSFHGYGGDATDSNNNYYEKGEGGSVLYGQTDPSQVGSGGGGARYSQYTVPQLSSKGGAGGGRINIDTGGIYFNSTSSRISANGQDGESKNSYPNGAYAGGGSGGSVKIVSGAVKYPNASLAAASVSEGIGGFGPSGGELTGSGFYNISANGGNAYNNPGSNSAGGGGGGYVNITGTPELNECIIGPGQTSIPPSCETKDVIIEGTTVTTSGHHDFRSLIIRNNGVLTHDAVVAGDNPATSDKKVDLTIAGNLTLESGGKIDVSGKGYPGGTASRIPPDRTNGMSCPPFRDGEWLQATASIYAQAGEGPGGGSPFYHCAIHSDTTVAGGAGYGGMGGDGYSYHGESVPGGSIYPAPYLGNYSLNEFEFGSGGGAATSKDAGYGAFAAGGAGGGRVYLEAQQIIFADNSSYIVANGYNGNFMSDHDDRIKAYGGGGSGGTILVKTNGVTGQFSPQTDGAGNGKSGTVSNQDSFNLNAKANGVLSGRSDRSEGGGAGGRIVIEPPPTIPAPTATLIANPTTITVGQSSTLHWTNTNATSAIVDNGVGSVTLNTSGDSVVTPASTTTYTLTATGSGGTAIAIALVTVNPLSVTAAKTVIVTVTWQEGLRPESIILKTFLKD